MTMRSVIVIAVLLGVACAAPRRLAPIHPASGTVIENEYIIVYNEGVTDEQVAAHQQTLAQYNGTQVNSNFHIGNLQGYSASFKYVQNLETVLEQVVVAYAEPNQVVKHYGDAACVTQGGAPWGLARTSSVNLPTSDDYEYSDQAEGEGVDVYIIDTGIRTTHDDFQSGGRSRAKWGANFIDSDDSDGNGHGTHVAGTVMGNTYGLAKKATAIAVKVLSAGGSGTTTGVIQGIEYVANQHSSNKKSVANMSLGGGKSTSLNSAVAEAVAKGVHFALAAGNDGRTACNYSPGSEESAVTVAASDKVDEFAYFSNYGTCTNIIAPGVNVKSAWSTSDTATSTISGTSMAAPHVAGVMAKLISDQNMTPAAMKTALTNAATEGKIDIPTDKEKDTPNALLYNKC